MRGVRRHGQSRVRVGALPRCHAHRRRRGPWRSVVGWAGAKRQPVGSGEGPDYLRQRSTPPGEGHCPAAWSEVSCFPRGRTDALGALDCGLDVERLAISRRGPSQPRRRAYRVCGFVLDLAGVGVRAGGRCQTGLRCGCWSRRNRLAGRLARWRQISWRAGEFIGNGVDGMVFGVGGHGAILVRKEGRVDNPFGPVRTARSVGRRAGNA